ncbi:MAG: hypothetical protein MK108_15295 [Mariniblastus sp.]|nr:hypothetical protein [Mariniblastus sp.]
MTWSARTKTRIGTWIVSILLVSGGGNACQAIQAGMGQAGFSPGDSERVNSFQVASAPHTIATRLTRFNVPFRINQPQESFVEVQLYLSRDEGRTWQYYGSQKTDSQSFPFVADGDGAYWFAVKTLDRNRQLLPDGNITEAELKVHVDREIPQLEVRVEADAAGRVVCYWRAEDDHLLGDSVRILYRENVEGVVEAENWHQVPVQLNPQVTGKVYTDQLAWWPETSIPYLNVRIEIADTAGNIARADRNIVVKQVAALRNNQSTAVRLPTEAVTGPVDPPRSQVADRETLPATNVLDPASSSISQRPEPVCRDGVCQPADETGIAQEQYIENVQSSVHQLAEDAYQLVGSPSEFAQPPVPDQWTSAPQQNGSGQPGAGPVSAGQQGSIPWPSESQAVVAQPDQANGSTTQWNSHPSLPEQPQGVINYTPLQRNSAPIEPLQTRGESFVRQQGDMIVSQSTTRGRGKQFPLGAGEVTPLPTDISSASVRPGATSGLPQSQTVSRPNEPVPTRTSSLSGRQPASDLQQQSVTETDVFRQAISNTRFQLQYGIQSVDPAGISRVVLWVTRDGGSSWRAWATDEDLVSPFPVQVQEPGTYGFQIVVHSRDGLTGRAPAPGDRPDIVIDVDTTSPQVKLISAPYGRGPSAGKLMVHWQVVDEHLITRPIRLLYSTTPAGPWTVIEEGLPNTGVYAWSVDKRTPSQVYLRIEARDRAGNLGAQQLQTPIDLSGLVPRGKILGLQQLGTGQ